MKSYIPELDSLRAVAAGLVLAHHLFPQASWASYGWCGVNLFFVLSGFLISRILLESPQLSLRTFYERRIRRIWPIYFLSIGLVYLISWGFEHEPASMAPLPALLSFTMYLPAWWNGAFTEVHLRLTPLWSVCVEQQFYLLWPLVLLVWGRRAIPLSALTLILGSWIARGAGFPDYTLVTRGDALGFGLILAFAIPKNTTLGLALFVGFLLALQRKVFAADELLAINLLHLGINLASFAILGICLRHSGIAVLRPLRFGPLLFLGRISYGIYIFHLIAFWLVDGVSVQLALNPSALFLLPAAKVLLTLLFASASWYWLEAPLLGKRPAIPHPMSSVAK